MIWPIRSMNGAMPVVAGVAANTFPVCTSRAASRARAPWRTYSCSTRTGLPSAACPPSRHPARYRGSFAYITGVLPGGEQIPLFRLRYGGSAHSFGFAIYSPARDRYEDAVLFTGLPVGSPQEALDTACTVHLAALGHEPGP
jgi:hypothetical protein